MKKIASYTKTNLFFYKKKYEKRQITLLLQNQSFKFINKIFASKPKGNQSFPIIKKNV